MDGTTAVLAQGCGTLEDHVHGLVLSRAGAWALDALAIGVRADLNWRLSITTSTGNSHP